MRIRTSADVGALIRDRRKALGLDQSELAERVGVSRKWVVEVEQGKPRAALRLVLKTLEVLGVVLRTDSADRVGEGRPGIPGAVLDVDSVIRAHKGPSGGRR